MTEFYFLLNFNCLHVIWLFRNTCYCKKKLVAATTRHTARGKKFFSLDLIRPREGIKKMYNTLRRSNILDTLYHCENLQITSTNH